MKFRFLSGNAVKTIAAVSMLIDHAGMMLFPQLTALRAIGRLAMPLFSYQIAEGCCFTRNRFRYFFTVALFGVLFSLAFYFFSGMIYLSIFSTFSFSILTICALQETQSALLAKNRKKALGFALLTAGTIACAYLACSPNTLFGKEYFVDYGFYGCMLPVFAALFDLRRAGAAEDFKAPLIRLTAFAAGLARLCVSSGNSIAWFSFFALIPLLLYNGKRGGYRLKYFFYVFYPAHLIILYLIRYTAGFAGLYGF